MNITQLKYFIGVVQQKSFTKAAEYFFVSESTISKSVRSLEKEYNVQLIDRHSKNIRLTPEGRVFYQSATKIMQNYTNETLKLHNALKNTRGSLRVGIPPVTITACFSSILYQYRHKYPDIHLEIMEVGANTAHQLVEDGRLDIGVIIRPFEDKNYVTIPVLTSEVILLVPSTHPLACMPSVTFSQLEGERFTILSDDYMLHDLIYRNCEKSGFSPDVRFKSSQWDFLVEMVASNQGISMLPKPIIDKFPHPKICSIHLEEPEFPWEAIMVYRKDRLLTAPMQCFIDLVNEANKDYKNL